MPVEIELSEPAVQLAGPLARGERTVDTGQLDSVPMRVQRTGNGQRRLVATVKR
jgi:hypothetical protein